MTWEVMLVIVTVLVCATALAAYWMYLVHDSAPVEE